MKVNWFSNVENIDWIRWWFVVTLIATVWMGLVTLVPVSIFKWVAVPLSAVQGGLLFAARGTKYVINRQEPPADGQV